MVTKDFIKQCTKNDRKAHYQLYLFVFDELFSVCKRYYKNEEDIQSSLNEVFLKVLLNLPHFLNQDKPIESFKFWCRRIAINNIIDQFRKNKKYNETFEMYAINSQESLDITNEEEINFISEEMDAALNELPEIQKTIVWLHVIEGYKHREISTELKMNENTIRAIFRTAIVKLKTMLEKKKITAILFILIILKLN